MPGAKGSADRIERACDPCYFEMYRLEAEMAAAEHAPKPPTGLLPPKSDQRPISSSAVTKVAVGARFSVRVEDAASDMLTTPLNKRDSAVSMDGVRQLQAAPSASRISVADTAAITQMPPSPLLAAVDLSTSLRSHILPAYFGALVYIVHRYFGYVAAPTVQEESGATITELPDDDSTTVAPSIARRLSETMASLQSILLTDRKRTAETSTSSRDRSVTFDVADTPKERRQRNPYDIISRRSQLRIETVLVEEQTHDVLYPLRAGKSATTFSAGDTDFPAAHDGGNDESDDGSDSEAKTVLPRQHKRARSMSNMSTRTAAERLPDHAQHVKDCQLCAEPFAIFRWRHECQQCHRIVCGTCASRKKVLGLAGVDTGDHPLLSPTIMRERGFAYGLTPLSPGSEVEAKRDRGEATAAGDPVRVCDLCFYAGDLDRTAAARTLSLGKRHRSKSTVILLGDPSSVSPASATFPRSPISPAATTPPPLRLGAPVRFNTIRRYDEWLDEGLSRKRTRSAASDRQTKHKRGTSTVF